MDHPKRQSVCHSYSNNNSLITCTITLRCTDNHIHQSVIHSQIIYLV